MSMAEYPSIRALMARHSTLWLCSAVFVAYVASHFQIYDAVQNLQGSGLETLAVVRSLALTGKFAVCTDGDWPESTPRSRLSCRSRAHSSKVRRGAIRCPRD